MRKDTKRDMKKMLTVVEVYKEKCFELICLIYSTHIFRTNQMAEHIMGIKDIDERLKSGDRDLVNEIANVEIKSYSMGDDEEKVSRHNFYSFATKFCCNHQPEKYAIYDKYVEQTLWRFIKEDLKYPASVFKRCQLRNYPDFFEMIKKFQEFYHLECKIRDLDRYLWIHGKRFFGK